MNLSILQQARAGAVVVDPFPYIVIDGALPSELYAQLEAEYPFEHKIDGYSGYTNNTRYQLSAVDALRSTRVTPLWRAFVEYHVSAAFFAEVRALFGPSLQKYYPTLAKDMDVGIRFRDREADLWMDCQPGFNSPVKTISSTKGPHLDHVNELFAALLYFKHPEDTATGGALEVYKYTSQEYKYFGQRFVDNKYVEKVASVPYAPNRAVMFLNTIDSVHGVSPRSITNYTRRLVNFIGEVDKGPLFAIPMESALLAKGRSILKSVMP